MEQTIEIPADAKTVINKKIDEEVARRAHRLDFGTVYELIGNRPFFLAGGSLCGDPVNDFDLYPDPTMPFNRTAVKAAVLANPGKYELLANTPNAITVKLINKAQVVQFCSYQKPSLIALVESFDFSHIQVGIRFTGDGKPPHANDVYYTDEFILANVTRRTVYTGSEYPLSSLIRLFKYAKRNKLTRIGVARAVMKILKDVLNRGFENYDDFKSQIDAIDLCLPDLQEAFELYQTCFAEGLVTHTREEN